MHSHSLIHKLTLTSSRNAKEALLTDFLTKHNNPYITQALHFCFDPLITFGVNQAPIFPEDSITAADLEGLNLELNDNYCELFIITLTRLQRRELTGHAALQAVTVLADKAPSSAAWNYWFRRILLKDLKCGVDVKTINKVFLKLQLPLIPVFSCQLAQDSNKYELELQGSKLVSTKLDGIRILSVVYRDGRIQQFSRNGKEITNFQNIQRELQEQIAPLLNTLPLESEEAFVLDGELMSKSFQDLMKQVYRKEDVNTVDSSLYLFDLIPLSDFQQGSCAIPQHTRLNLLETLVRQAGANLQHTHCLKHELINLSTVDGRMQLSEINKEALAKNYEGIMIKDPTASYECKRTTAWLKLKPFIEVSLTIIGFEEGTGKNVNRLGALICEGVEEGKQIRVHVGGGFSEELRADIWKNQETLINHVVEVRADAITKNQDSDTYSLRFPRFLRFRGQEAHEKM